MTGKPNLGISLALAHIMAGTLKQFNGCSGSQVTAANTHNHTYRTVAADLFRSFINTLHFLIRFPARQCQPAGHTAACSVSLRQQFMGIRNLFFQCQQIRQRQFTPHIGDIHIDHGIHVLSFFLS